MSFLPQALDERTLKNLVSRLHKSLQQKYPSHLRSGTQEHVAHMLGFQHWHEAITAIGSPRAKPAVGRAPLGGPGLYPAEPLRFSKDHCEALLLWALQIPFFSSFTVESGEQPIIEVAGEHYQIIQREWTWEECENMAQALGADAALLATRSDLDFSQSIVLANGERHRLVAHAMDVHTKGRPGIKVSARTHAPTPPSLNELGYTPEQMGQLCKMMDENGMVLIAGGTGSGKSTTLSALIRQQAQRANTKHIVFDAPIEFEYDTIPTGPDSSIETVNLQASLLTPASEIVRSLHRHPTHITVGTATDMPTLTESIHAAENGSRVNLGIHAESVPDALTLFLRGFGEQWKLHARQLAQVLNFVLAQRLEKTTDGKRVAVREWLSITPSVRQAFLQMVDQTATLEHFMVLMESFLQQHGHPFVEDAERLTKERILPEQTLSYYRRDWATRIRGYEESTQGCLTVRYNVS